MSNTITYDDPDVSIELTIGEEEAQVTITMNGDLSEVKVILRPHDLESFQEFLSTAAEEAQVELHRQEMEAMQWHLRR